MTIHILSAIALALVFVLGTTRPVNIGILALIATFVLGTTLAGESPDDVLAGFPADIFVLLVGVTYLFGLAATNGTLEWVVERAARAFGDRPALVPWLIFIFSSVPTMAGALGPAGVAMLAPLCLRLGERYGLSRRMCALMVMHGSCAGNFSPINGLALIAQKAAEKNGLEISPMPMFLANLAYNVALGVIIYVAFGGLKLLRESRTAQVSVHQEPALVGAGSGAPTTTTGGGESLPDNGSAGHRGIELARIRPDQVITLIVIIAVAIAALGFDFDLGFLALTAAALLHTVFAKHFVGADKKIVWTVVLLICGVTTLVEAMERFGTVNWIGSGLAGIGTPLLTAFLLCAVGALTSAFGSSAGLIGVLVPLAVPFVAQGGINATWLMVALVISATVVDAMPFSSVGALTLSTAPESERPRLFRFMLIWGAIMIVTAPVATWLLFILPTSL